MVEAVAAGAPRTVALVAEAGEGLGRLLAQVNALLDPDVVIVGGEAVAYGEPFRQRLEEVSHALAFKSRPPVIFDWQDDSWTRGAAALAVQHFFDFEAEALAR
jgi:predicted NBD/HSP70 family sugar kinase